MLFRLAFKLTRRRKHSKERAKLSAVGCSALLCCGWNVEAAAMTAAASRADATNLNDKAKHTASHG